MYKNLVGIVPSFTQMGAAIFNPEDQSLKLKSGEYLDVIKWISKNVALKRAISIIENPNLVSINFKEWEDLRDVIEDHKSYEKWLKRKSLRNIPDEKTTMIDVQSMFINKMNIAQKFGADREATTTLIKLMKNKEFDHIEISPEKRDDVRSVLLDSEDKFGVSINRFQMPKNMNQIEFKYYYEKGVSCQAKRDAATLVLNKSIEEITQLLNDDRPKTYPSEGNGNFFLVQRK